MTELHVTIQGELRPAWLLRILDALDEAHDKGWHLKGFENGDMIFHGHPYVFKGEPHVAKWTHEVPTALDD